MLQCFYALGSLHFGCSCGMLCSLGRHRVPLLWLLELGLAPAPPRPHRLLKGRAFGKCSTLPLISCPHRLSCCNSSSCVRRRDRRRPLSGSSRSPGRNVWVREECALGVGHSRAFFSRSSGSWTFDVCFRRRGNVRCRRRRHTTNVACYTTTDGDERFRRCMHINDVCVTTG